VNTYETVLLYIRTNQSLKNMRQACYTGTIPVSYNQARRCVRKAEAAGLLIVSRPAGEQGRPLVVKVVEE
jgi:hypothetical protein